MCENRQIRKPGLQNNRQNTRDKNKCHMRKFKPNILLGMHKMQHALCRENRETNQIQVGRTHEFDKKKHGRNRRAMAFQPKMPPKKWGCQTTHRGVYRKTSKKRWGKKATRPYGVSLDRETQVPFTPRDEYEGRQIWVNSEQSSLAMLHNTSHHWDPSQWQPCLVEA